MKLSDLPKTTKLKLGMYGVAGSHKTRSILTIPDFARPVAIADIDFGAKSLLNSENNHDIYVDTFREMKQFDDYMDRLVSTGTIKCGEDVVTPKTFVLDSWSSKDEMFRIAMVDTAPMSHTKLAWGSLVGKNEKTMFKVKALPIHTVVIFHANVLMDDAVGVLGYEPISYGKNSGVPQRLPQSFDEFYFCNAVKEGKEVKYVWMTTKTDLWMARSRTNLPASIPMDFKVVFDSYGIKN